MKQAKKNAKKKHAPVTTREVKVPRLHQVLVECSGEREQQRVYELLVERGHQCRVLTL